MTPALFLLALAPVAAAASPAAAPDPHAAASRAVMPSVVTLVRESSLDALFERLRAEIGSDVELRLPRHREASLSAQSALIIDAEGHAVTTASFVSPGGTFRVKLPDGSSVRAIPVGLDPRTDLAVLALEGGPFHPAPLARDSHALGPGTSLCVVGAVPPTRCPQAEAEVREVKRNPGAGRAHDFLVLGPGFVPGSGGAALVQHDGRVVGIVSALRRDGGALAVPVETIRRVTRDLIDHGAVRRAWLGLTVVSEPDPEQRGIRVAGVVAGSPAEAAGIEPGDRVLRFAGARVSDVADLARCVAEAEPGDRVPLLVARGEATIRADVALAERLYEGPRSAVRIRVAGDEEQSFVAEMPQGPLALEPAEWTALEDALHALGPGASRRSLQALDNLLRHGDGPLSPRLRGELESLKLDLRRLRPPAK